MVLELRFVKPSVGGSNPSPSAKLLNSEGSDHNLVWIGVRIALVTWCEKIWVRFQQTFFTKRIGLFNRAANVPCFGEQWYQTDFLFD
tara:strand:- start:609 stop:869 length:261 start_codon:yes stop_codon:yes gene_type:complete